MRKHLTINISHLTIFIAAAVLTLSIVNSQMSTVRAQSQSCSGATPYRAEGLVAATNLSGKFSTSAGACVVDPKAAFLSFKIPSFADLKVQFYTQAKNSEVVNKHSEVTSPANLPGGKIALDSSDHHLYSFTDNVTLTGNNNFTGNKNGVIFVGKDLNIGPLNQNQLTVPKETSGLVFVVGGNVNIDSTVTRIDAVIISSGTIYTGGGGCNISQVDASALTVNGSFISLDSTKPIKFCRKLTDNQKAAEVINWQPKYLAILNNLFASSFQKWSEIAQ